MLNVVSLFSGIDGFGLGLERTGGFRVVAQVEQDPFCLAVLEDHWPDVPRFTDVCTAGAHNLPGADVVVGGFPCQGLSFAGLGLGLADKRSGLWSEMLRIIRELRPRWVIVENVSALLARGMDVVLGGLAAIGYDAEWDCLPASAFGAPHQRDRVWLVAYPQSERRSDEPGQPDARRPLVSAVSGSGSGDQHGDLAAGIRLMGSSASGRAGRREEAEREDPDADRGRFEVGQELDGEPAEAAADGHPRWRHADGLRDEVADAADVRHERPGPPRDWWAGSADGRSGSAPEWWATEPDVGRVAYGVPARVDRLRALGNALVPQIAEWIGQRILEHEGGVT